jgi:hypothetical protein
MHTICISAPRPPAAARPAGAFPKPRRDAALATLSAHEVCTSGYPPIIFFCHPTFLFFFSKVYLAYVGTSRADVHSFIIFSERPRGGDRGCLHHFLACGLA